MGVKVKERFPGEYWIYIYHGGRQTTKMIGPNKKLAERVAKEIGAKLILGDFNMDRTKGPLFNEYAANWYALPHDWKESTRAIYGDNLKRYIYPAFRGKIVEQIDRKFLQSFFDKLAISGLSTRTVGLVKTVLSGVFNHAVNGGLVERNIIKDYTVKKKKTSKIHNALDNHTEVPKLLDKAQTMYDGLYYPLVLTALRTGMRIGELLALRWDDIDFEKRLICVRRNFDHTNNVYSSPKNHKQRYVYMTDTLTEVLKTHMTAQKRYALKHRLALNGFVFTNKKGEVIQIETFRAALNKMQEKAGLKQRRIHDLRHSYATHRAELGHDIRDISHQLGHSSLSITQDVYTEWKVGQFSKAINDLDMTKQNLTHTRPNGRR